jgi:uncharacterized protein YjbI with pentapeptide repeats
MRNYTYTELVDIISNHELWLDAHIWGGCADLSNADLSGLVIGNKNLMWADFSGSNLNNTIFVNCNLTYCDFTNADCSFAYFTGNDCSFASFTNANCTSAIFNDCIISNANFTNAKVVNTTFPNTNRNTADFNNAVFHAEKAISQKAIEFVKFFVKFKGPNIMENSNIHKKMFFSMCPESFAEKAWEYLNKYQ